MAVAQVDAGLERHRNDATGHGAQTDDDRRGTERRTVETRPRGAVGRRPDRCRRFRAGRLEAVRTATNPPLQRVIVTTWPSGSSGESFFHVRPVHAASDDEGAAVVKSDGPVEGCGRGEGLGVGLTATADGDAVAGGAELVGAGVAGAADAVADAPGVAAGLAQPARRIAPSATPAKRRPPRIPVRSSCR